MTNEEVRTAFLTEGEPCKSRSLRYYINPHGVRVLLDHENLAALGYGMRNWWLARYTLTPGEQRRYNALTMAARARGNDTFGRLPAGLTAETTPLQLLQTTGNLGRV